MDNELKHILFEIDHSLNEIAKWNKLLGKKFNNYNSVAYIVDLNDYKSKVYGLNVYCRALKDKLENG
jgi:hypothetical protein